MNGKSFVLAKLVMIAVLVTGAGVSVAQTAEDDLMALPLPAPIGREAGTEVGIPVKGETAIRPPSGVDGGILQKEDAASSVDDPLSWLEEDLGKLDEKKAVDAQPEAKSVTDAASGAAADTAVDPFFDFDAKAPAAGIAAPAAKEKPAVAAPVVPAVQAPEIPLKAARPIAAPAAPAKKAPEKAETAPVAVPVAVAPAVAEDVAALQREVDDLRVALDAARAELATAKAALAKAEARAESLAAKEQKAVPAAVSKETKKEEKPAAQKSASKTAKAAPAPKAARVPKWKMKSVKPGMAWLVDAATGEMKTVAEGDTVTGLGKISRIGRNDDGKWVVTGSAGSVRQ